MDLVRNGAQIAGSVAGAIALSFVIAEKVRALREKKKKRRMLKKADFGKWIAETLTPDALHPRLARAAIPEVALFDRAATAKTKNDYRAFNESFRELVRKNQEKGVGTGYIPRPKNVYLWENAFADPDDEELFIYKPRVGPIERAVSAIEPQVVPSNGENPGVYGIKEDVRVAPLTYLAAGMLPDSGYRRPEGESAYIGNLAYAMPGVMGLYAKRKGWSAEQKDAVETNGLDRAVMDAIKWTSARYPASRNVLSAYINGGFGDVSDMKGYGIKRPFWDYSASAPTLEGSNALKKVVADIRRTGAYHTEESMKRHYDELLRFFDNVGPYVFMPKTALGDIGFNSKTIGLFPSIEKGWRDFVPFIEKHPDIVSRLDDLSGGMISQAAKDAGGQADRARRKN